MPPIDHTPTAVIPRAPSDTGPLPAVPACDRNTAVFLSCPAWRRVAWAALALAWVAVAEAAYLLGRIAVLLWAWR